jgi:diketogulonate reductase-like aldo/keto reductase
MPATLTIPYAPLASVLAIPGTGSLDHLEENLTANDLSLSDEDLSDL